MKIFKKLSALCFALLMCLCCITPSRAINHVDDQALPTPEHFVGTPSWPLYEDSSIVNLQMVDSPEPEARIPNINLVVVTANATRNGIVVHVSNLGLDPLDSVTVTARITGYETTSLTASVPPIIGKDFTWNAPMTHVEMSYDITLTIRDGSTVVGTKTGHWELNCTESSLVDIWHPGTRSSRQESLQYHFDKHHRDYGLNIYDIPTYIEAAVNTKWETYDYPNDYRVVMQAPNAEYVAAHKYTNKYDGRFVLLADSDDLILSFGGA